MTTTRVTLDQWRMLTAVVDHGGYAQAGEVLHKSQSAISYGIRQLEERLQLAVFRIEGRKAVLTDAGQVLLRRARSVLAEAQELETMAGDLARGWEPALTVAVDVIFPDNKLFAALRAFAPESRGTRVEIIESVLSGSTEAIARQQADLAIAASLPEGLLGDPLIDVEFACVANPQHPLFDLGRPVTKEDLRQERQIVVRDSGAARSGNAPWLEAEQRWTVSHLHTSINLLSEGLGFAWVPLGKIGRQLEESTLALLPMQEGGSRKAVLKMAFADSDRAGPATRLLAEKLRKVCQQQEVAG